MKIDNTIPYSEMLDLSIDWWMDFYLTEKQCIHIDMPLTDEELTDVLNHLIATLAKTYNRNEELVREDLIIQIEKLK